MEKLFQECIKRELRGCTTYTKLANYHDPINTSELKGKGKAVEE